jgi:hypothetical protein
MASITSRSNGENPMSKSFQRVVLSSAAGIALLGAAQSASAALVAYSSQVNSRNPIAYLMMDESSGTTAADSSPAGGGNGTHPGTYSATGITYAQSSASTVLGTAISTTGVTPITIAGSSAFDNIGTGDFSVELWFNTSNISSREDLFTFKGGSSDFGIHLGSQTAGRLSLYHGGFIISSSTPVTANAWHHLVVTRASGTDTMYLDGVSIGSGADAGSVNTSGSPIEIGSNTGNSQLYTGSLDEFAFYPSALSAAQVQADYVTGVPEPASVGVLGISVLGLLARRRRNV